MNDQCTAWSNTGNMTTVQHNTIISEDDSQLSELNSQASDDSNNVERCGSLLISWELQGISNDLNISTPAEKGLKWKRQNNSDLGKAFIRIEESKLKIRKDNKKRPLMKMKVFERLLHTSPQKKC